VAISAALFITCLSVSVAEASAPRVVLNNRPLVFDVDPFIMEDRVMVPMRTIFEALGAEVEWNPESRSVTARSGGETVFLSIDSRTAFRYSSSETGTVPVDLDPPPIILGDRTIVPLRFVSESLKAAVRWDGSTGTVYITK